MNKKVMAIAVAGALAVPSAMALAQTSTVQIGGSINLLYYQVSPNNPDVAKKGDILTTSEPQVYVRGEEKLGRGLSTWFQCTSSMDGMVGGAPEAKGMCARNSGIGFKGSFGNLFFGNWDMPMKFVINQTRGWFSGTNFGWGGSARLLEGGSSSGNPNPSGLPGSGNSSFYRRHANTVNWHSPTWSGFRVYAAMSAANETHTSPIPETSGLKPRLYSVSGHYTSGPLWIGVGYENHKDFNPASQAAATYTGGTDDSWVIGARYTFAGVFRLSGRYTRSEYETTTLPTPTDLKTKGFSIHADWKLQGPHSIKAQYAKQDDPSGTSPKSVGRYVGPLTGVAGLGKGANHWTLAYQYQFSKRTRGVISYNRISNDAGSAQSLGEATATLGGSQKAVGFGIRHSF